VTVMKQFVIIWILFWGAAGTAYAHKVTIFAWVEGDTVFTESKFSGGKKVQNAPVEIFDMNGRKLLEGKTDKQGAFSFRYPQKTGMKVLLHAGMGHQAEWVIPVEEFQGNGFSDKENTSAVGAKPSAGNGLGKEQLPESAENASVSPCLNADNIRDLIDNTMDKKLKPIIRDLSLLRNPDHEATFRDIMGGIGYILGLIGIGAYFNYRKKRKE